MYAAIDTGTTNTRIYIIDDNYRVVNKAEKKIGVRETAITGSKKKLKEGLLSCFEDAVRNSGVGTSDIKFILISGMLTSEIGLLDIPHLKAPVGIQELVSNVKIIKDTEIFPVSIPLIFIPGIKNNIKDMNITNIRKIDFMKGEETQVFGILQKLKPELPCNVIFFSSHTKLIHISIGEKIAGSITTLSGQIYEAIKKQTFIGKSITHNDYGVVDDFFSAKLLKIALESVENAGFLRSLMMPRFMEVLMDTTSYEREFFVNAVISSEDIKILHEAKKLMGFDINNAPVILIGNKTRCRIFKELLKINKLNLSVRSICDNDSIDEFVVEGGKMVVKQMIDRP
ncbi:MAG: 2-dehydro-3-deoxygalactonokinase [Actinomycetota bacterium]|nr:2-dehydro-3-deoxygalactonokinase [Actinomycetota bacterium]